MSGAASPVKVSVIIPTFNRASSVGESIESVLSQEVDGGFELVVVDDGSTDSTAEVLAGYTGIVVLHQENAGPSAARNHGIGAARGEYIAFLDSDDIMAPGRLQAQLDFLEAHEDVDGVLGRQLIESIDGTEPPPLPADPVFGDPGGINLITVMISAEWLRSVDGFDPSLRRGEDRDLLFRLKEKGARIDVLDKVVLIRRMGADSLTFEPREGPTLAGMVAAHLKRAREGRKPEPDSEDE